MASVQGGGVAGPIEHLFRRGTVAATGNGPLLERFAGRRDEAAFAALVALHGPMVLGVCRRVLADRHDVEDAFQATFLVLARKAGSIRQPDLLGHWLHGVARRVAVRARARTARRQAREQPGAEHVAVAHGDAVADAHRRELESVLDEEIGRLPEKYRRPVVLCYLEGRTQEEAALALRWTPGMVRGRLAKARDLLRARMTRRGHSPTGPALGASFPLDFEPAIAAVPPPLASAAVQSAIPFAAGQSAAAGVVPASASALALARGVLTAMSLSRWMLATPVMLGVVGLIALPLALASEPEPPKPPAVVPEKAADVKPDRSPEQRLMARMARTYAEATSYQDEGEVTLVYTLPTGKNTRKQPFSTKFFRPKMFYRYEFTEPTGYEEPKRFVIWNDQTPARFRQWWTIQPEVKEVPVEMAIASGTGISSGSSLTIPRLLLPAVIRSQALTDMTDLTTSGEEVVDDAPCTKLTGKTRQGDAQTVWIDNKTSLVRKIHILKSVPGNAVEPRVAPFTVEATTTYRPRLDAEIDPRAFAFEPPKTSAVVRDRAATLKPDDAPAQKVMARLVKTYRDAKSYQDEGVVTLVFVSKEGKRTQKKPFLTKFVRPKLYRYEFTEPSGFAEPRRYVIWSDAAPGRAKTWWTIQPTVKEGSLANAVGTAAGVSNLSSLTVPSLLMPSEIPSPIIPSLKDLTTVGEEAVDGALCTKIAGKDFRGETQTVWVDKATSLVRKTHTVLKIPDNTVEQTTEYRPRLDVEIDPKAFEFEPPKS